MLKFFSLCIYPLYTSLVVNCYIYCRLIAAATYVGNFTCGSNNFSQDVSLPRFLFLSSATITSLRRPPFTSFAMATELFPELQYRVAEILVAEHDLVAEHAESSSSAVRQTLYALRQTSKFLSGMTTIKASLFTRLTLEASQSQIEMASGRLGSFHHGGPLRPKRHPPPFGVQCRPLAWLDFRELAQFSTIRVPERRCGCPLTASERTMITFSGTQWDGQRLPKTNFGELEDLFHQFRKRAMYDEEHHHWWYHRVHLDVLVPPVPATHQPQLECLRLRASCEGRAGSA